MREIKFRVFNKFRKLYDTLQFTALNGAVRPIDNELISSEECILEQYTGLKDKNGVEVYEGDRYLNGETGNKGRLFYQESPIGGYELWCEENQSNGEPYHYCRFGDLDLTDFEVIGNIHEEEK